MTSEPVLTMWVITDHPADYPDHYVVREQLIVRGAAAPKPGKLLALAATLDEARAAVPPDATCIGRQPEDDPVIVEVWV